MTNQKQHFTDSGRLELEHLLDHGVSFRQIAMQLGKHPYTVSREVRNRAVWSDKWPPYRVHNRCVKRRGCLKTLYCEDKPGCTRKCPACSLCNARCDSFEEEECPRLGKPPYTCNGCPENGRCVLRRRYYDHKAAHKAYRETLAQSREGANITESGLAELDSLVTPLIRQGQSVNHIINTNPDKFSVGNKTIYRYVSGGLLTAKNIDMPRVVRMKPRKTKAVEHKVDKKCRIGRTYEDFMAFTEGVCAAVVEMDSVIGRVGGKCLLTLMLKSCGLMLAFIREHNDSQSVIDIFDGLYGLMGPALFQAVFPLLLADNGSEFSNPSRLEFGSNGQRRTHVFYCNPNAPYQKANVELNHEFIRRILPKGTSFDALSQQDVDLMMSHINSYAREILNYKSPIDVFECLYGKHVLGLLGMRKVAPSEIILKPSLLR